jgi:hypothetical protein
MASQFGNELDGLEWTAHVMLDDLEERLTAASVHVRRQRQPLGLLERGSGDAR